MASIIDRHLTATERRCGRAPSEADVLAALPENADAYVLDRYLLDREVAAGASTSTEPDRRESLPPKDIDQALELTRQHELIAPCTTDLPGTASRDHARGLIGAPTWFLHERP